MKVETGLWCEVIAADGTYLRRWGTEGMEKEEVKELQETGENGDEDGEA